VSKKNPWIGVDLDGTLAHYVSGQGVESVGAPIPKMVERVKGWLAKGKTVKILTARVAPGFKPGPFAPFPEDARAAFRQQNMIQSWCLEHIGRVLPVTAVKDLDMEELYDDRAIGVVKNTGELLHEVEYQRGLRGPVCTHDRVCDCR
jgi:hypothetical protein